MTAGLPSDVPDLVPARMINEVLYCERLMYLEWAQGEFLDSADTVEGRAVHKRADRPGGRLPDPKADEPDPRPVVARSIWLSSERLGITAKIDLVESESGRVTPVEYKRGRKPRLEKGAYLPERAQVCAQVLLLREHGFECEEGLIYFARDRQRVSIAIDEELETTTLEAARRARELTARGELPPALVDDPKCTRCSLAPICLPEEIHHVERATEEPVAIRRLHPARDDRLPVYVQEHAAKVTVSGNCLVVQRSDGERHEIRISNTSQVSIIGNAQITTQALRSLLRRNVPVAYFTPGGWFSGRVQGFSSNNIELRVAQHRAAGDPSFCLKVARALIDSKIRNCRTLLRRNGDPADEKALKQLKHFARKAREAESLATLLGIEGSAARVYFGQFTSMLKTRELDDFDFSGRNRRPPRDPLNALLSFAYSVLTKDIVFAVSAVGLEPLLGFYHQPRFGRPALALDLMEEFRPLIADSVVLAAVNNGSVTASGFVRSPVGCALTKAARKSFLQAYERRMDQEVRHPVFGYRISYRRVLEVQARLLARVLLGDITEFPTFQTR